jgi:hypothetical protein
MSKIPTAEEFFEQSIQRGVNNTHTNYLKTAIDFANLHCEAQQKAILKNVKIKQKKKFVQVSSGSEYYYLTVIDKKSIINAYPLENIK